MASTLPRSLTRALAATAGVAALVAVASPASATFIFDHSDEVVAPPALSCAAGTAWSNPVTVAKDGSVTGGVHMIAGATTSVQVPGLTFAPGLAWVQQSIVWDGYKNRTATPTQHNEQVRYEFYKGGTLVAATNTTTDLGDAHESAWSVEPLDTVNLPDGADAVYVKHSSTFMATDGSPNSLYVTGACFLAQPIASKLSAALTKTCDAHTVTITNTADFAGKVKITLNGTTTEVDVPANGTVTHKLAVTEDASNTVVVTVGDATLLDETFAVDCAAATTTSTTTTVPPTTTAPTTTIATKVLGETEVNTTPLATQPQLAFTGRHTGAEVLGAAALLVGGGFLVQQSRRKLQRG